LEVHTTRASAARIELSGSTRPFAQHCLQ
jgi:hypothetical protein